MVSPQSKIAAFQIHVNHLISFIWFGVGILIFGAIISMWPDIALEEAGAFSYVRAAGAVATAVVFGFLLASGASSAYAAPGRSSPPHRGPPAQAVPFEGPTDSPMDVVVPAFSNGSQ